MMKKILTFLGGLIIGSSCLAQKESITPLFAHQEPIVLKLNFSIKEVKKIKSDTIYTPSFMHYKTEQGNWDSLKIGLRARGNFRRANCSFPPLRLKIKKADYEKTPFAGNRNLKLVIPCQSQKSYSDLVVKELMCYKIYEAISTYHFNTRFADLTLIDGKGKQAKTYTLASFFIEDDDLVAKRFKGKIADKTKIHRFSFPILFLLSRISFNT